MSYPVDLGRCLYHATESQLQLHFSAIAHFTRSDSSQDLEIPTDFRQWPKQPSIWITEAPELEIRFSIGVHSPLELATSTFICDLARNMCHSRVWSDLGFSIVLKRHDDTTNTHSSRFHYIKFGLCRDPKTFNLARGRALPDVLRNPPDAHAPPDVPVIFLAAIDVYAEYEYTRWEQDGFNPIYHHRRQTSQIQWMFQNTECHWSMHMNSVEVAGYPLAPPEHETSPERRNTLFPNHGMDQSSSQYESNDNLSEAMLRLVDFGLRRLVVSPRARDRQIKIVGEDTLQSLTDLAPAVFSSGYREAMHQRAASIPIISKALASMFANSKNAIIISKLASGLQQIDHSNEGDHPSGQHIPSLKSTIQSSLWCIAQQRTRRPKNRKESQQLFAQEPTLPQNNLHTPTGMAHFADTILPHSDPLDLDNPHLNTIEHGYMEYFLEDENLLSKTSSESSFESLDKSTPASQNDTAVRCEPYLLEYNDTDMLLSNHEIHDTYEGTWGENERYVYEY